MASIIKRKKNYSIVYNYTDENGGDPAEVGDPNLLPGRFEAQGGGGKPAVHGDLPFRPATRPSQNFFWTFVSLYGEKKWGVSMYDSQNSLIANYINPIIGI